MTAAPPYARADRALARRLERAEARSGAAYVESRARLAPDSGAEWREIAGTYALYDGVGSPLTQTFGLGLLGAATDAELAALEAFYDERGAAVQHEISPLADPALLTLLPARGYHPVEFTSVLYRPVEAGESGGAASDVRVRPIAPGEEARWADAAARGWGELPAVAGFMRDFALVSARSEGTACFIAELAGEPIGTGIVAVHDGVALLAGASTIPAWRGRGAQTALLVGRLRYAAEHGCDLATMGAEPGTTSQQNAERQGFRIAYSRLKWIRR